MPKAAVDSGLLRLGKKWAQKKSRAAIRIVLRLSNGGDLQKNLIIVVRKHFFNGYMKDLCDIHG